VNPTSEIIHASFDPRENSLSISVRSSLEIDGAPVSRIDDMAPLLSQAERDDVAARCRAVCGEIAALLSAAKGRTITVAEISPAETPAP
jgi:hypothetical protein